MRVLHFYKTYYPDSFGGIEQVIRQMCVGTAKLGAVNQVLTLTRGAGRPVLEIEGHRVLRAPLNFEIASNGVSWRAIGMLEELAAQADVLHYHFPWPFMDAAHFLARVNKPTVLTYHSDIVRQKKLLKLYQPLMHRFLKSVDRIVATSPNYLASSAILARYRNKVETITYGLDKSIYPVPSSAALAKWRERCGERFFLFVGMLRYYKGLHVLLDALEGNDFPTFIVGAGPVERELKERAQALRLRNVHFLGALPEEDKAALLQLCHAFVFPSHLRSEAFGISLLEAAMYGKPMISCEIGTGTSYINVDGETGIVVPPSDSRALRAAMQTLWEQHDRAKEMGEHAQARYRNLFAAETMAANYFGLYGRLLQEAEPRSQVPVAERI
jgi:rhamnosyl/mannosyltransferase